jgi:hypothetical protein
VKTKESSTPPKAKSKTGNAPTARKPTLRISPNPIQVAAGGDAQTVDVTVEGNRTGPVEIAVEPMNGIQVDPPNLTLTPDESTAQFKLTAAANVRAQIGALIVTLRGDGNNHTQSTALKVTQLDFTLSRSNLADIRLRPGQTQSVELSVDRRGGYRGPILLAIAENSQVAAARVTVPAGQTRATLTVKAKAALGSTMVRVKATANDRPIDREVTLSVHVFDFQAIRTLMGKPGPAITSLAFDSQGQLALSGNADGGIALWDIATGQEKWRNVGHKKAVRALAFSHDGKNALSGSDDLTAAIWNVRVTGELVKRLSGEHGSSIVHVYFQQPGPLPDTYGEAKGTRLLRWTPVTIGSDWRVLWDEHDGVRVLRDRTPSPAQIHWSQTRSRDVSLRGLTSDTLEVYKGTERRASLAGNGGAILKMDLNAAADRALTLGSDGHLRGWDVSSRSMLSGMPWKPDREIAAIALSPDGTTMLLGGSDGTLKLWTLP